MDYRSRVLTVEKINEFLAQVEASINDDSEEEEVNIFGRGLADKVSRLPRFQHDEDSQKESKNKSMFQPSYLSSIQSIRGIEKDKLNRALQDRMNRLAIMDHNFKVAMNKRILSQPKNGKIVFGASRLSKETEVQSTDVPVRPRPYQTRTDRNIIKF